MITFRNKVMLLCILISVSQYSLGCGGHLAMSINADLSSLTHAKVGDVVYKKEAPLSALSASNVDIVCPEDIVSKRNGARLNAYSKVNGIMVGKHIYETLSPDIGIRISVAEHLSSGLQWHDVNYLFSQKINSTLKASDIYLRIELIKISGKHGNIQFTFRQNNILVFNPSGEKSSTTVDLNIFGRRSVGTCQVLTDNINIDMGSIPVDQLATGRNSQLNLKRFILPVHCEDVHNVFLSLQGEKLPYRKDVLSLLPGAGSAKGVGVQILYKQWPLTIGVPVNISELFANSDTRNIELYAKIFSSYKNLHPGKIQAIATIKIDYI